MIDGSLSALDARVARHILDNAIKGDICRDKIVLMITYDLDQAAEMDHMLLLKEGLVTVSTAAEFFSNS